jgi:ribonuclease R
MIRGKLELKTNGSGYLITDTGDEIYVYKKNIGNALHNDIVDIDIIKGKYLESIEGKVINIVERAQTLFTGTLKKSKDYGFLITDSKRMNVDFYLTKSQIKNYRTGEKLLVELKKWKKDKSPECKVIKSLGMVGENDAEINSIIYEYNLKPNFPEKVEEESENIDWNITEEEISKRKDFRNITTFTIDPDTAKDFDDAISIEKKGDKYEIGIHIADVSHYIQPKSELDKEAEKRATSVYLVDRVIPMLPERLSNGVCSLRPNEDKLCYSVVITIDKIGKVYDKWIGKTIINSDYRFTYDEAQKIIEGEENKYSEEINILNKIAQNIRIERSSLLIEKTEVKFEMDEEFKPIGIKIEKSNESHQLIEEFMLLANKIVGEYLSEKDIGIYRIHEEPNSEKIYELKEYITKCGFDFDVNNDIKEELNKLTIQIKDTPFENAIQTLIVRTMPKAKYSINNIGHYGLGFEYYTHFTSPIRRYSDLLVHRILYIHQKQIIS